jgi:hypothetical protein
MICGDSGTTSEWLEPFMARLPLPLKTYTLYVGLKGFEEIAMPLDSPRQARRAL